MINSGVDHHDSRAENRKLPGCDMTIMKRERPSKSRAKQHQRVARPARRAAGHRKTAGSGTTPTVGAGRHSIVGLGASAGGLDALKRFFGAMPPRTGLSFVVVVHLDPTHDSLMPELLARSTTLGVHQALDRQPLEADHVYIIPPKGFFGARATASTLG
jgi:chemotaxis response regulator CheB